MINPNRNPSAPPYRMEGDSPNNALPDQMQEINKRLREQPVAALEEPLGEPSLKKIKVTHAPLTNKTEIFAELFSKAIHQLF